MKYLSITQTTERWGISTRRIQILCGEGRVPGAIRIGSVWGIPEDAEKPADARIKNGQVYQEARRKRKMSRIMSQRKTFCRTSKVLLPLARLILQSE